MNELKFGILAFLLMTLLAIISIIIAPILCKLIPDLCDIIRDFTLRIIDKILFKIGANNNMKIRNQYSDNIHNIGIYVTKSHPVVKIFIDKNRVNAFSLYPADKDGRKLTDEEINGLEEVISYDAELEVLNIDDIALLMNKESFDRFCELWKEFHEEKQ